MLCLKLPEAQLIPAAIWKRLTLALITLTFLALSGCASTTTASGRGYTFFNPTYHWSISYPDTWRLDNTNPRWLKLSRGNAIIGIHGGTEVAGKPLDEVVDTWLRGWEQNIGTRFQVLSRRHLLLSGNLPAIEVVHHIGSGNVGKSRKIFVIVRNRAFVIDAEAYLADWPQVEPEFNRIIDSFTVQTE